MQKKHCERKLISSFSERQFCRAVRNFKNFMTKLFSNCVCFSRFFVCFSESLPSFWPLNVYKKFLLLFKRSSENHFSRRLLASTRADLFSSIFTFRRFNENLCSFSRVIVNNQRNLIRKKVFRFFSSSRDELNNYHSSLFMFSKEALITNFNVPWL